MDFYKSALVAPVLGYYCLFQELQCCKQTSPFLDSVLLILLLYMHIFLKNI